MKRLFGALFGTLLRVKQSKAKASNKGEYKRHLNGSFYVEHVCENGEIMLQYVEAQRLTEKGGCLYLYGWCEMMPAFRWFRSTA